MKKFFQNLKKMSTWNTVLKIIAPIAIGGEVAVYVSDGSQIWHWVIATASLISILIKSLLTDTDNNGFVDQFEGDKKPNA